MVDEDEDTRSTLECRWSNKDLPHLLKRQTSDSDRVTTLLMCACVCRYDAHLPQL